jgi:hypothetical protein
MSRHLRFLIAALLVAAAAAAPLAAEVCAVSCDGAQHVGNEVPACHRHAAPAPRATRNPQRCGHDHAMLSGTSIVTAIKLHSPAHASDVRAGGSAIAFVRTGPTALHASISPPGVVSIRLAAPLRI